MGGGELYNLFPILPLPDNRAAVRLLKKMWMNITAATENITLLFFIRLFSIYCCGKFLLVWQRVPAYSTDYCALNWVSYARCELRLCVLSMRNERPCVHLTKELKKKKREKRLLLYDVYWILWATVIYPMICALYVVSRYVCTHRTWYMLRSSPHFPFHSRRISARAAFGRQRFSYHNNRSLFVR